MSATAPRSLKSAKTPSSNLLPQGKEALGWQTSPPPIALAWSLWLCGVLALVVLIASVTANPAQAQDEEFRRPGLPPLAPPPSAPQDTDAIPPAPLTDGDQIVPVPDRNRIIDALGVRDNPLNPYQQSTLKGDRPVFDDWFVQLNAILDTTFEPRSVPTPVSGISSARGGANDTFGDPRQSALTAMLIPNISIIKGDTTFMPPEFEFEFTPAISFNRLDVQELGITNIDPRKGSTRDTAFIGIQEAFIDYHIRNVSDRFDFDSIRVGVQPFNADFRGFLFQDDQLGVRLFGDRANNRFQYNLAYFRRIEKDTNSGLNDLSQPLRRDSIGLADLFIQDLPVHGFTTELSAVHNWNDETGFHYDKNGFLVVPASDGLEDPHRYQVTYLGLNGDGHLGPINLDFSFYYALGSDSKNEFSGQKADISAWFFAAEPSYDIDFVRIRGSFAYASGDSSPKDNVENGFDSIFENPQFAGADTSYFIRQSIPLIGGGGVALSTPNGMLPDLRSSKGEGQSNFINPGLTLIGLGADFDILPELRYTVNVDYLRFNDTETLEALRQQGHIPHEIGYDFSNAIIWRPFDTQNVIVNLSGAVLLPGDGLKRLYTSEPSNKTYYSVLTNIILAY